MNSVHVRNLSEFVKALGRATFSSSLDRLGQNMAEKLQFAADLNRLDASVQHNSTRSVMEISTAKKTDFDRLKHLIDTERDKENRHA